MIYILKIIETNTNSLSLNWFKTKSKGDSSSMDGSAEGTDLDMSDRLVLN